MQGNIAQRGSRPADRRAVVRYGAAVLAVTVAVILSLSLQPSMDAQVLLLVAVMIAGWVSGLRPALLAALLAALAFDYYFTSPFPAWRPEAGDLPRLVIFALLAVALAMVTAGRRTAEELLKSARDDLSVRVRERTTELQRSNEQLLERANLLDLTHDTVMVRSIADVITLWNRGAEELYGWSRQEAIGRVSHDLLHTVFPEPMDAITEELDRTGRWEGELVHTRRDGTTIVVASRWAVQTDEQGTQVAVLETNNDISEHKRAEEALRLRANLLAQTHDAIIVWEFPGKIIYWNRGAERLYGFSSEEALGRATHNLLQTEHPMPTQYFDAMLEREGQWSGELPQTTRDGRRIVVDSRHSLTSTADGRRLVLETNRDISERKRAEQALEELAGRLIRAQEEERSRIGRELHDHISQMLGVLTIQIDQLRADPTLAPVIASALDQLRKDAVDVTDDVRRLSHRLHSSMLDYLGLAPALQKLVAEFSERCSIPMHFEHTSIPAPLPSEVALALFRVTEESLANIVKHSHARSGRVAVHGASDGIHLIVEDDGNGFDMTSLASKGGLGFVSMQERLRALRGTVRVESAPSRGTTIDVWIPSTSLAARAPIEAEDVSTGQSLPSVSPARSGRL